MSFRILDVCMQRDRVNHEPESTLIFISAKYYAYITERMNIL